MSWLCLAGDPPSNWAPKGTLWETQLKKQLFAEGPSVSSTIHYTELFPRKYRFVITYDSVGSHQFPRVSLPREGDQHRIHLRLPVFLGCVQVSRVDSARGVQGWSLGRTSPLPRTANGGDAHPGHREVGVGALKLKEYVLFL